MHTSTTKSDVAWLIEKIQSARKAGPEYWSVVDIDNATGWDMNVNFAMRFDTQKAAQDYIDVFAIEDAVAVEHAWISDAAE